MTLARTLDLLATARDARCAVLAFNVITLESAEAIVAAAERTERPVILQVSENTVRYHGALEPIAAACRALAEGASAPIALHLDHASEPSLCHRAVDAGFGSVMLDASDRPWDENVRLTTETAAWAHERGIGIEGELGLVGGKDGIHAPGVRTVPEDARRYVEQTGVDALAVAVGTSHGMVDRSAVIDLELVARLRDAVPVPLVLHGSSGVPDNILLAAVRAGIVKVNLATQLNQAFTAAVRERLAADPGIVDPRRYLTPARAATVDAVAQKLELLSSPRS